MPISPPFPRYPDVNGVRTSYCSIEFGLDGIPAIGVDSINYRDTHEIGKIRGSSASPIGRTRGNGDAEGDITIYQAEWNSIFLPKLTRGGAFGYAELAWPVKIVYAELLSPDDTVTDRLEGVRLTAADIANAQGTDATKIKLTMNIMKIFWSKLYVGLR